MEGGLRVFDGIGWSWGQSWFLSPYIRKGPPLGLVIVMCLRCVS